MPVTSGQGNPNWTRDEIILVMQLYFKKNGKGMTASDPDVQKLSKTLNSLKIHPLHTRKESFRNPSSVAFKLLNLKQIASGNGLKNTGPLDSIVWNAFYNKPDELNKIADTILMLGTQIATDDEDSDVLEFNEGKVLYRHHRTRERHPKIRKSVLSAMLKQHGFISCSSCGLKGPNKIEDNLCVMFEVHHLRPLSESGETKTRVVDLSVLCANCHRLIHYLSAKTGRWHLPSDLKSLLEISKN